MRRALRIAGGELTLLVRSRLALVGIAALLLLSGIAAATSWTHMTHERLARAEGQAAADHDFDTQPDRHPHRMVHYGHYAHRPVNALAAFDPGVDPFTGTVIYLEGHRQNSAVFGAVRESSSLMRFGLLTPAFVLQTLAPLLLIFLGFATVSREKATRSLIQLRTHGASAADIVIGKALALALVAAAALAPALLALAAAALAQPAEAMAALVVGTGYAAYLLFWCCLIVAVSALAGASRTALMALVTVWTVTVVLAPRVGAELASRVDPLPLRAETDLLIQADLREMGDSHNPDDPFFNAFRERTLAQYGVSRVEDLPFNYRGAVSAEGEALTSSLFDRYASETADIQRRQFDVLQNFAWLSPAISVRRVSMAGAATDLDNHLRFLEQAERYRFDLVQRLNRLHADGLSFADDSARSRDLEAERRTRVSASNWRSAPDFKFEPASASARLTSSLLALGALGAWLAGSAGLVALAVLRTGRAD